MRVSIKSLTHKLIAFFRVHAKIVLCITWLLYGLATAYVAIQAGVWEIVGWPFETLKSTSVGLNNNFMVSFAASMIDTFAFFSLIGIITFVITLTPPEEEEFKRKLHIMFPDAKGHKSLTDYLHRSIGHVACVCELSQKTFVLKELTDCSKFMKIVMKSDSRLKTIHYNETWVNEESNFQLKIDHPPEDQEIIGAVTDINVSKLEGGNVENIFQFPDMIELTKEKNTFNEKFPMEVSPNGVLVYKSNTWMWQNLDKDELRISYSRFTHTEEYEFNNQTGKDICIDIISKGKYDLNLECDQLKKGTKAKLIEEFSKIMRSRRTAKGEQSENTLRISVGKGAKLRLSSKDLTPQHMIGFKFSVKEED